MRKYFVFVLVSFLKAQWKYMRDNQKRCLVKRNAMTKSGVAAHTLPKCKFFNQLQFLQEKVSNKESHSNFNNDMCVISNPPSDASSSGNDAFQFNAQDALSQIPKSPTESNNLRVLSNISKKDACFKAEQRR